MHTSPADTGAALDILRRSWNGPMSAYPESGYFKSPDWVFTDISPDELLAFANIWHAQGVIALGGCCGIGAQHIAHISAEFAA
jgi:S-methylmethionine-dependent homocysteine/selenocysteine methylase